MKRKLNLGLVGHGFMGKVHANAFRNASAFFDVPYQPLLKAVSGRNEGKLAEFADRWGFESHETDWRKLIDDKNIDLIDIACPNDMHCDIAIAAAAAGKMVMCEKPLARNSEEAERMVKAVEAAGVPNMVWYIYRRAPAVALAKELIEEGRLGKIFHYRSKFLQDYTISSDLPQGGAALWRLDGKIAGSGVIGDLISHCVDTAIWLNGSINTVSAMTETFVKKRRHALSGNMEDVTIDDACSAFGRFENGSLGTFEATRYARGHKALYTFEINGEHGSIAWDLQDLHRLQYFDHRDPSNTHGWRSIHVTGFEHPYMDKWWVPGLQIGYGELFVHQFADFLNGLGDKIPPRPTFRDALGTQRVCDAVLKSGHTGRWEEVVNPNPREPVEAR